MAIIDEQEINSIKELRFLMDANVETLCRNIKRRGGVAAAPAGSANLGHMIGQWAQKNISLAAYWLCHSERISRARQPADITVVNIHSICALRDAEDNYEDATPLRSTTRTGPRQCMHCANISATCLASPRFPCSMWYASKRRLWMNQKAIGQTL